MYMNTDADARARRVQTDEDSDSVLFHVFRRYLPGFCEQYVKDKNKRRKA